MEVNFNNLRKQACFAYDRLANKLNNAIENCDYSGNLEVRIDEIQDEMDTLRQLIASIAMCYEDDNPDMADVFEEIYPDDKNMVSFNPDKE